MTRTSLIRDNKHKDFRNYFETIKQTLMLH